MLKGGDNNARRFGHDAGHDTLVGGDEGQGYRLSRSENDVDSKATGRLYDGSDASGRDGDHHADFAKERPPMASATVLFSIKLEH